MSSLHVAALALELITLVRPLEARIKCQSGTLANQLRRSADSVALNTAEAEYSDPGNRRARLFSAAGSANETRAAVRVALAWGYFSEKEAEGALAMLERIIAMLWRLTHRRPG